MRAAVIGQPCEAGSRALADLAELLDGPSEMGAELGRAHVVWTQLGSEGHPLIRGQLTCRAAHPAHLLARDHDALDVSASVDDRDALAAFGERERALERRGHRATPTQGSLTVPDARVEAQLESICEMSIIREPAALANMRDQLEYGLAEAVLEVLMAESVSAEMKKERALGERDDRNGLGRVNRAGPEPQARAVSWNRSSASGRHTPMSLGTLVRPPLNFLSRRARG